MSGQPVCPALAAAVPAAAPPVSANGAGSLAIDAAPGNGRPSIRAVAANTGVRVETSRPTSCMGSADARPLRLADTEILTPGRDGRSSCASAPARAAAAPTIAGFSAGDVRLATNRRAPYIVYPKAPHGPARVRSLGRDRRAAGIERATPLGGAPVPFGRDASTPTLSLPAGPGTVPEVRWEAHGMTTA